MTSYGVGNVQDVYVCVTSCFTAFISESNAFTIYDAFICILFVCWDFLFGVTSLGYQAVIFNLPTFVLWTADRIHRDAYYCI